MASTIFLNIGNDAKMPALGYGTWQAEGEALEKSLEVALETGYRHIDTAQRYNNEEAIGKVLKKWFDSGKLKREDVFIATKLSYTASYPEQVEECLIESLKKLQLDYVDLYSIHIPITCIPQGDYLIGDPKSDYIATYKAMEKQYDAGRTKFIGVSNFSIKKIQKILDNCRIKPANNQIEVHTYFQQPQLVDFCHKNGITIVAYAPLGPLSYFAFLKKRGEEPKPIPSPLEDEVILTIARKHSKTAVQVILRFLLQLGVSVIPKSVTPARIRENYNVFDFALDSEDIYSIRKLHAGEKGKVFDFSEFVFFRLRDHPDCDF